MVALQLWFLFVKTFERLVALTTHLVGVAVGGPFVWFTCSPPAVRSFRV